MATVNVTLRGSNFVKSVALISPETKFLLRFPLPAILAAEARAVTSTVMFPVEASGEEPVIFTQSDPLVTVETIELKKSEFVKSVFADEPK